MNRSAFARLWRKARWALVAAPLALGLGVAGLPWLLELGPVRQAILAEVNRLYAPSVMEASGASVSWFGPVRFTDLVLRDERGKAVVSAPRAMLDRSLLDLLFDRPRYGTLTLYEAVADIERHPDGSIDLADALGPFLASEPGQPSNPNTDFTLKAFGSLILNSPELAGPLTAEAVDLTLNAPPVPGKLNWQVYLANPDDNEPLETLSVVGDYDHRAEATPDLSLEIAGASWPLALQTSALTARTTLDGTLALARVDGQIETAGDLALLGLVAAGPLLSDDTVQLDRLEGAWDLAQTEHGWTIDRLELDSALATLHASTAEDSIHLDGRIDLAALARQAPNSLRLRDGLTLERGSAELQLTLHDTLEGPGRRLDAKARLTDLAARQGDNVRTLDDPATLSAQILRRDESVNVEQITLDTPFLKAIGSGDLDQGVQLSGSFDLNALNQQLREWVDLGTLDLDGRASFAADYRRAEADATAYNARLALVGQGLTVVGLTAEPIRRQEARVDLVVQGPALESGFPSAWRTAWAKVHSGANTAEASIDNQSDSYLLKARAAGPLTLDEAAADTAELVSIALEATYPTDGSRVDLHAVGLSTRYGRLDASGRLDDPFGQRLADLRGTIAPDWAAVSQALADSTEPQAAAEGQPRPFHIRGPLSGSSAAEVVAGLDAELGLDLTGARAFGMQLGPSSLVARVHEGQVQIDPIRSTLNGGQIDLRPELQVGQDGDITLRFAPGSAIARAEINDEVSRSVLAYVAPILHEATQVRGHVSVRFDRAEIPLAGSEDRSVDLAGRIDFEHVNYGPGPITQQLLALTGVSNVPSVTLHQPVAFTVADGRVTQSGLSIVATEAVAIEIEGSVGFDGTLALRAGVPVTPSLLGNQERLSGIIGGTRVGLPIGGTLSRPMLDRSAFQAGLREASRGLMRRAASEGASQLLRQLGPDDAPDAGSDPSAGQVIENLGRGLIRNVLPGPDSGARPNRGRSAPPAPRQEGGRP